MAETLNFATLIPSVLDTRKVFRQALVIEGRLPIARLERLSELLADCDGDVNARLLFTYDEARRRRVEGRVVASIRVICQRCLEPVELVLDESVKLAFVASEAIGKDLPVDIDPWVCAEDDFKPVDIIEEQLILAVPFVAFHERCNLRADVTRGLTEISTAQDQQGTAERSHNPFAILATLKNNGSDKH
jgi:uncharacterized protein